MAAIFVIMLIVVADIILRFLTAEMAIRGTYELSELFMILIIYLTLAVTQAEKEHVRVTLLIDKLPFRIRAFEDAAVSGFTVFMLTLLTCAAIIYAMENFRSGRTTAVLFLPIYPFAFIMALGMATFTVILALDTIDFVIKGIENKRPEIIENQKAN